jgi:hypothetical protein
MMMMMICDDADLASPLDVMMWHCLDTAVVVDMHALRSMMISNDVMMMACKVVDVDTGALQPILNEMQTIVVDTMDIFLMAGMILIYLLLLVVVVVLSAQL